MGLPRVGRVARGLVVVLVVSFRAAAFGAARGAVLLVAAGVLGDGLAGLLLRELVGFLAWLFVHAHEATRTPGTRKPGY